MPHVVLERDGLRIETELALSDIKELMGLRASQKPPVGALKSGPQVIPALRASATIAAAPHTGFDQFFAEISDRGRNFIRLLSEHPQGIEAKEVARYLGFTKTTQIGGLAGGGLSKVANRNGFGLGSLYRKKITTPNGVRTLTFYPTQDLISKMRKPA